MSNNKNANLTRAKQVKNDEYYTLYEDIEKEMQVYLDYNPDVLRGKTVLCPCDDPDWSNFTRYFMDNFKTLGLKRLTSTCIAANGDRRGKWLVMDKDGVRRGVLQGTGDFRTEEIREYRDQADVIVTNPPFSLLRAFVFWIMEAKKQFLIVGNLNTMCSKFIFPYYLNGSMRVGYNHIKYFTVPVKGEKQLKGMGFSYWFTNLPARQKPTVPLSKLVNIMQNSKYNNIQRGRYLKTYNNIDAVEVPSIRLIPADYDGAMGVPINFFPLLSPDQFELLGRSLWDTAIDGKRVYQRIIIRLRQPATSSN
jgi:hypothetical protein